MVDLHRAGNDRPRMMRLLREITAGFVGITDQPGILYIPELMELYPDVKVVLVTRDPEKWWKSIEPVAKNVTFWWLRPLLFPVPSLRWLPEIFEGFIAKYVALLKSRTTTLALHTPTSRKSLAERKNRNKLLYGEKLKPGVGMSLPLHPVVL
jgi:hypothetical protein